MISIAMLDALQDDELRSTKTLIHEILEKRDEKRKIDAIENARAVQAKALNEARTLLEAAGLTLRALEKNGRKKAGRGPLYIGGHTYQHPANKALVWNAKGQKPNWLRELEAQGGKAIDIAVLPASANALRLAKSV